MGLQWMRLKFIASVVGVCLDLWGEPGVVLNERSDRRGEKIVDPKQPAPFKNPASVFCNQPNASSGRRAVF